MRLLGASALSSDIKSQRKNKNDKILTYHQKKELPWPPQFLKAEPHVSSHYAELSCLAAGCTLIFTVPIIPLTRVTDL